MGVQPFKKKLKRWFFRSCMKVHDQRIHECIRSFCVILRLKLYDLLIKDSQILRLYVRFAVNILWGSYIIKLKIVYFQQMIGNFSRMIVYLLSGENRLNQVSSLCCYIIRCDLCYGRDRRTIGGSRWTGIGSKDFKFCDSNSATWRKMDWNAINAGR